MRRDPSRRRRDGSPPVLQTLATRSPVALAVLAELAVLFSVGPAWAAGEIPAGAELIMSDWILGTFLLFFGSGLVVFLIAARVGAFRNLEDAKYYLLTVEEEDYYTPDWAKDDE